MLKKVKQRIFPPSSRTFSYFSNKILEGINGLKTQSEAYSQTITENDKALSLKMDSLEQRLATIEEKNDIISRQLQLYSEALLRKNSTQTTKEARKTLFKLLPEASGTMRLSQLATAKLMKALCVFLEENQIEYWFGYGSLLGAYLRNGFIPWDDDIDICIFREGLDTLSDALRDNPRYQITILYDIFSKCIQYRFCTKNENNPIFIDLGVWDYATEYSDEKEVEIQKLRASLVSELEATHLPYWEQQKYLFDPKSGSICSNSIVDCASNQDPVKKSKETKQIKNIFRKYLNAAKKQNIICDKSQAKSVLYSLDNLTLGTRRMLYPSSMILPTRYITYEDFKVRCPNHIEEFLNECYSDWPYLPNDASLIGNRHYDQEVLKHTENYQAIIDFLKG